MSAANPTDRRYTTSHEWAKPEGDLVVVGITAFAVEQLTEPTFLELPPVGKELTAGAAFGVIEGPFVIAELTYSGLHDDEALFAIRLVSAGAVSFEA